jgi:hypothetical protein
MENVTCPNPSCTSGGVVGVIIRPIMYPGELLLCPGCGEALDLTVDQLARAMLPET